MGICHWPVEQQPREKLLNKGAESLSDAEVLAIFLRTGIAGKSALSLAQELLDTFNDLPSLLSASHEQLCNIPGLGPAKCAQLQAALEMGKRYATAHLKQGIELNNPLYVRRFLITQLRSKKSEVFACLFLDGQHRLIQYQELFNGTVDAATVYPREVLRRALELNACAVILAHNHPSQLARPSLADENITAQLKQLLKLIEVELLDHLIIAGNQSFSFLEHGLLMS